MVSHPVVIFMQAARTQVSLSAAEDDDERLERALAIHEQIRSRRKGILQKEASLEDARSRVLALIDTINKVRVPAPLSQRWSESSKMHRHTHFLNPSW